MSASPLGELVQRRLDIVQRLAEATSAMQKLQQMRAGAEMDVQRCEMALDRGPDDDLARELLEAEARIEESERGMAQCEADVAALESILAETDHAIESAARA